MARSPDPARRSHGGGGRRRSPSRDEHRRDRRRSRERSPPRGRYDDRPAADYYHPNKRPRRDDSYDGYGRRDERRDGRRRREPGRLSPRYNEPLRQSTTRSRDREPEPDPAAAQEEKQRARLAKIAEWKKKREAENPQQAAASSPASGNARTPASPSPAPASPAAASQTATGPASPASPAPYAGKFDPKEIRKRALAAMERQKSALGGDVLIPKSADQANGGKLADNSKATASNFTAASKPVQRDAKISGFGLNKTTDKQDKLTAGKGTANLEEEEESSRKLEKLPDMPMANVSGDAALANDLDAQDDAEAINSDDDEAEQVREAAQKRAEAAQAEQQDVSMTDVEVKEQSKDGDVKMADEDEEEIDPLDAFMNTLEDPAALKRPVQGKKHQVQVFDDDDNVDMDAVGDGQEDFLTMAANRRTKRELAQVDHKKMQYEDFRKEFYSESVELADMTPEDVDILRADLDNIKIRGKNPPKPILKWSQGGFNAQVLDVIREQKYDKPTSIQSQALPAIMSGRDVIGVAKTGSGKTVSFILPMFRHIKDQRPLENLEGPIGLIFAPTRELATQIHRDCKPYCKALGLRAVCAYGGAPIKDQVADLKRGAEIVVATPGRFIDLLLSNAGRVTNLTRVTYVVLDEADRMFDMGFEPQIMKVLGNIRPDRQVVLFSATFPKMMEAVARKVLKNPLEITVGGRSVVAPEITQQIEIISEKGKFKRLLELLGNLHDKDEDARSLIFVERQESADSMLQALLRKGYPCLACHGGREQIDRDQAISDFKAGVAPVMIATSVAARGLDVKQLKLVVNYDSPNHLEDYVHRAGRTGRAGNTGTAVTFVTPDQDRFATFLIKALTDSKQEIPADLKALQEQHEENVKAGEVKKASSGFGGRGIERLDAARDAERAREKRQYKTGDEPDDEEEEKTKDKKESTVDALVAKAAGSVRDRDSKPEATGPSSSGGDSALPANFQTLLNNAMTVKKAATPPAAINASSTSGASNSMDPMARARAIAASIASRKGTGGGSNNAKPGAPTDNRGPDAGAFHAILEINDFPQKARWGVTNRTNVAKVLENTGTSITNKGIFYPPGKEPGPGEEAKLYVLVEGDTEMQVTNAMSELTRLLKEGTIAALDAESRVGPGIGRYSVV